MPERKGSDVRRTAWLVLSPWLAVAVASGVALAVGVGLHELFTTDDGGLGNLGGGLAAVALAGLLGCAGSVALLYVVASRAFPVRVARAAVGWAVLAAVAGGALVGGALGFLGGAATFVVMFVPFCLPAAGTVAFLVAERRGTHGAAPSADGRRRARDGAALVALAGALVGATVGVVVDVVALKPSRAALATAARELVPPGYTADEPVPIGPTLLLDAHPPSSGLDLTEIEATIDAAGWRILDVERSDGAAVLVVARGGVDATVVAARYGIAPYSVTVRRSQVTPRGALVGGLLGAGAGAAVVVLRRRRPSDGAPPDAGTRSAPAAWVPGG